MPGDDCRWQCRVPVTSSPTCIAQAIVHSASLRAAEVVQKNALGVTDYVWKDKRCRERANQCDVLVRYVARAECREDSLARYGAYAAIDVDSLVRGTARTQALCRCLPGCTDLLLLGQPQADLADRIYALAHLSGMSSPHL